MFLINLFLLTVRIGILVEVDSISIVGAEYSIKSEKRWYKANGEMVFKTDRIEYKKKETRSIKYPLFIRPKKGLLEVNSRIYPGTVLIRKGKLGLIAVNYVSLEDYIMSVVRFELGSLKPEHVEALKAQAIAARSYCLSHLGRQKDLGFDLFGSIQDQVYLGLVSDSIIRNAVMETEGKVLIYNHKPIEAKYHSTCGGITAYASDVWPVRNVPYLVPVTDRDFCKNSPHYQWRRTIPISRFSAIIRKLIKKESRGKLVLKMIRSKESRRILRVEVDIDDQKYKIPGYRFRNAFNLKSTFFKIEIRNDSIIINGGGWGHGVGMCQWGAIGMAEKGYNYRTILKHYYPNTKFGRLK